MDDFVAAARGRLRQLKSLHDAGRLDAASYDVQRRGIEQEIGERLLAQAAAVPERKPRPSIRLVAALGLGVMAVAVAGYVATGSPSLVARSGAAPPERAVAAAAPDPAGSDAASSGLQQIAAMVDQLAARMKERPDDAQGWTMLARSYTVLGRFDDALPAYKRASELQPKDATLLADYADTVAATQRTANNPESMALIARALAVDPTHPKALALAGTADYDRGDFAGAIARWQAIADRLPPESELGKQIAASIADARSRLGPGAAATAVAPKASAATPAGGGTEVTGTVSLDPAIASKAAPGDTVFVFARAAGGSRMPLAIQRATVAELPLRFKLDDSMAMAPGLNLSSAKQLIVGARISKSGNAMPSAGDLSGEAAPVAPGTHDLAIRIDRIVAAP